MAFEIKLVVSAEKSKTKININIAEIKNLTPELRQVKYLLSSFFFEKNSIFFF